MLPRLLPQFPWKWLKRIGYGLALVIAFVLGRFTDLITILDYLDKPKIECSFTRSPGYRATPHVPFAAVLPLRLEAMPGSMTVPGGTYVLIQGGDTLELSVSPTLNFEVGWLNRGRRAAEDVTLTVRASDGTLCCPRPRPPEPLSPLEVL